MKCSKPLPALATLSVNRDNEILPLLALTDNSAVYFFHGIICENLLKSKESGNIQSREFSWTQCQSIFFAMIGEINQLCTQQCGLPVKMINKFCQRLPAPN